MRKKIAKFQFKCCKRLNVYDVTYMQAFPPNGSKDVDDISITENFKCEQTFNEKRERKIAVYSN